MEAILNYPSRLETALIARDVASRELEHMMIDPDELLDEQLLLLEKEKSVLEAALDETKGRVELEYRRHPPDGDKVTEATVSAHVKSSPPVSSLRRQLLEKEYDYKLLRQEVTQTRRVRYPDGNEQRELVRMVLADAERTLTKLKAEWQMYELLASML